MIPIPIDTGELTIRQGRHDLSPFVINLKSTQETLNIIPDQEVPIRLNLLHPAMTHPCISPQEPGDALTLKKQDILSQIREDLLTRKTEPWILMKKRIRKDEVERMGDIRLPNQESILPDAFLPKKSPENIFSYFDLPEEELNETDESELVELDRDIILKPIMTSNETRQGSKFTPFLRPVGVFVLISFVFVLPLHAMNVVSGLKQTKSKVEFISQEAFSSLRFATDSESFSQAGVRFSKAQTSIEELGLGTSLLLSVIPKTQSHFAAGKALLAAGEHLTAAGSYLTKAMSAIARETNPTPVSRIRLIQSYLRTTLPHLTQANQLLQNIGVAEIPQEYQQTFLPLQNRLPTIVQTLSQFDELSDLAIQILGGDSTKRYLLVFQNNTEIRATGGFMGSFAELKVRNGVMEHLFVPSGGTYDLQGLLRESRLAPQPLQILSARWEFQDANWFPDFPTSARQIIEFYRDAGGPSVDGVIAVNATYVADLIGLLGPIEMPAYGRTIDSENFLFEAQTIVELEYDRGENKPKQFIGDLAPKLVERTLEADPEKFLALIDHLSTGLAQKEIQLYSADEKTQRAILNQHWGGAIEPANRDYLLLVDSNLGGGKTDGVIEQKVDLAIEIQDDDSIINTVTIKRTHHGLKGVAFTGVNNVDYLRLYVPKGSELIEARGFRTLDDSLFEMPEEDWIFDDDLQFAAATSTIHAESGTTLYEENGKTVFGNWVFTAPGETETVSYRYRLPFGLFENEQGWEERLKTAMGIEPTSAYSLTIQKQAGIVDRITTVSVSLPEKTEVVWKSNDLSSLVFDNKTDAFFALLLK